MEPRLQKIIFTLLSVLPDGVVIDAGANNGHDSKLLARTATNRTVLSVEPLRSNLRRIETIAAHFPNMRVVAGGLGAQPGESSYGASADQPGVWPRGQTGVLDFYKRNEAHDEERVPFTIHTIDDLVGEQRLALAHLDVEGSEMDALRGGSRVIGRDKPVLTVETFPTYRADAHAALQSYLQSIGYRTYVIPEPCGSHGCRNMLCIPDGAPAPVTDAVERLSRYIVPPGRLKETL
tara:strand:+ start:1097 stop:1801 length:705 start_codon:yes stop_codon:yes gene_type:complete